MHGSGTRIRAAWRCLLPALLLAACHAAAEREVAKIAPAELASRLGKDDAPLVLDVRSEAEFAAGHIPGAVNIPHDALASRTDEIADQRDREIVVHCKSGRRAGMAEGVLRDAGFQRLLDLDGHMQAWEAGGYPVEK